MANKNKAVFLDRDGTLIEDPGYLGEPAGVKLLPGVELAVKSLRQAGYKIVVVTNQSGIARGMFTEDALESIHTEMRKQFADKGSMLDAIYYCPYHPDGTVEKYAKESDLRKPAPGMLNKAAEQLNIDLSASWLVGDSARDIGAGQRAGCRTIRIRQPNEAAERPPADQEEFQADITVRNLVDAARVIMRETTRPTVDVPKVPDHPVSSAEPSLSGETDDETPAGGVDSDVRKEILRHVRQISRQADHEEFNLPSLLGGVSQVLVGLFLLLVFWKALGDHEVNQAMLWALVGVIFQVMSLTFFTMAKK